MSIKRQFIEVPYQSYSRIKRNVLFSKKNGGRIELFTDPSFPPDKTSLTYVYSGDDRYERTVFQRPQLIDPEVIFAGVGGTLEAKFPWRNYQKRGWFRAAVVTVSLCVRYMEKVIPGYRNGEQNLSSDYIGAFHFNIWRFGDWIECVVDDSLPMLDGHLLYCPFFDDPPEVWAALVEKAYAKIMKTYEAIENGDCLDALTDLTGAICEFYIPDINPPENLFNILFKSCQNRSLMVCWRNDKRLTPTGFQHIMEDIQDSEETESESDADRYLHIITAVTKFPLTDRRIVEVVRLKCPYKNEPAWNGKFSESDKTSWESLSSDYIEQFRPMHFKDKDEYWMTFEDFRINFGGIIICNSTEPYRAEGFGVARTNSCPSEPDCDLLQKTITQVKFSNDRVWKHRNSLGMVRKKSKRKDKNLGEINVVEDTMTVKFDNTRNSFVSNVRRRHSLDIAKVDSMEDLTDMSFRIDIPLDISVSTTNIRTSSSGKKSSFETETKVRKPNDRRFSILSRLSDNESSFSTSDISLSIQDQQVTGRPRSAPMTQNRGSSGSLSHLTQSNFLATRTDCFRSHGAWKQIVDFKSKWTEEMSGASIKDMDLLSKNPRVLIVVQKKNADNELLSPPLRGKSHILVSLLQDYRNGIVTGTTLCVQIGIAVFKCRHPEKDEKRNLSKLQLVFNVESKTNSREVRSRLDLEEGYYFIVPYCLASGHKGEFLVRALDEKDIDSNRNGCVLS